MSTPAVLGRLGQVQMVAPVLRVRDLAASVAWYRDRLGLVARYVSPPDTAEPLASFDLGGSLVLWQLPSGVARDRADNGRNSHIVVVVDTDLEPVRQRLVEAGVEVTEVRRGSDNSYFDVYDLDGNRFEISRPALQPG